MRVFAAVGANDDGNGMKGYAAITHLTVGDQSAFAVKAYAAMGDANT